MGKMLDRAVAAMQGEPGKLVWTLEELRKAVGVALRSRYRLSEQLSDDNRVNCLGRNTFCLPRPQIDAAPVGYIDPTRLEINHKSYVPIYRKRDSVSTTPVYLHPPLVASKGSIAKALEAVNTIVSALETAATLEAEHFAPEGAELPTWEQLCGYWKARCEKAEADLAIREAAPFPTQSEDTP